jgi:paraquat-inducible protein A
MDPGLHTEIIAITPQPAVICHECDLPHARVPVERGRRATCVRCGAGLYKAESQTLDRPLALALAGMVLFAAANFCPFLTFEMEGREQSNSLISGSIEFWNAGYWELATLVFLASICLPFLSLALILYVLVPLHRGAVPWKAARATRAVLAMRPWAMMEVYLLGVLVAIVKLTDFADIALQPGFYAFVALIVAVTATNAALHPEALWQRIGSDTGGEPAHGDDDALTGCHDCGHVLRRAATRHGDRCPRCEARLHHRKPDSLSRTWALLIASVIFYVPANIYPIMTVISFGQGSPDTILSGVIHLIEADQWPIALLVFFASIFVPMLKITMIAFLLISVHIGTSWRPRERTAAYRLTEFIGRWSMIDIFMISILVALVKLDAIATIEAGPGAVAFAAVVVLTMLSAMSFDPRLIWDRVEARNG